MSETTSWLEAVIEVATVAGEAALGHFGSRPEVERKADGSPVTIADRQAETAAREWIERRFPGDGILGEELGEKPGTTGRRWVLDPIDGTVSFVTGVPLWSTLVGLLDGDECLAGAIHCPAVGEIVAGARGAGAWRNGTRTRVSTTDRIEHATVLTTDARFPERTERRDGWARLAGTARVARTWGDGYGYLLLATGRAEAMIDDRVKPWDAAALLPIVAEAGGKIGDWRGNETAFGGDLIATNGVLDEAVRALLVR